jgi:diguanylate cyclase (GGDEF)-like protein
MSSPEHNDVSGLSEDSPNSGSWDAARRHARWEAAAVAAAALLVVVSGIFGVWYTAQRSVRNNYAEHLATLAQAAAVLVDPQAQRELRSPGQTNGAQYRRAVEPLRRFLAAVPEVRYLYTVARDGQDVRFVLDAADPEARSGSGLPEQSEVWQPYAEREPALLAALGLDGSAPRAAATAGVYSDPWGRFVTGWAPVYDSQGSAVGAVGVDVDAALYLARLRAAHIWSLLGLLPAFLLIGVLSYWYFRQRLNAHSAAIETRQAAEIAEWSARRLGEERERLDGVLDATGVGTWAMDLVADNCTYDERCASLVGEPAARQEPMPMTGWMERVHEHDRETVRRAIQAACERKDGRALCEFRLRHADGHWVWILSRGQVMARDPAGKALALGGIHMDISSRKQMESELEKAAQVDKLTGLANRARFLERLQAAVVRVREGRQDHLALLYLDFDRFKMVNDTLGHAAGDELLRQIADRLSQALRSGDARNGEGLANVVGRFGGDEFLVLVNDLKDPRHAARIAERLLNALSPAYDLSGNEVFSSASIGIVCSSTGTETADELVRNADLAMYEAKHAGRACSVEFSEVMHTRLLRHVTVETALRRAIGTQELSLAWQPIVALDSGRMVSAETLLRWQHPVLGSVSPAEFIPIAEDSGLIVAIGQWVLRESCAQLAAWRLARAPGRPEYVSVNLSRTELALGNRLYEQVRSVLQSCDLPGECLQLEVTEREVMRNPGEAMKLMRRIQSLGVRFAMDDFGTGTSSLAFLRDYPFNTIKIDRSFVKDLEASKDVLAVIHATISLVENLGMASVAEGVETPTQLAVLQSLGCRYAQGYYFSKPVPAAALLAAIAPPQVVDWAM